MSFFPLPAGLVATGGYAESRQDFQDAGPGTFRVCWINPGDHSIGTTNCGLSSSFETSASFDVPALFAAAKASALAAGDRPDYYVYEIAAQGDGISPGLREPGCDEIGGGCLHDDGPVSNHMSITGGTGSWVWPTDGADPVLTEIEGTLDPTGPQTQGSYSVRLGNYGGFEPAYLANPAPPLPVPDGAGNAFTEVLFTEDQVPDGITITLTSTGGAGPHVHSVVACYAVRDTRTAHGPTNTPWMCVL